MGAASNVSKTKPRQSRSSLILPHGVSKFSNYLENRQRQHDLGQEADGEGERAEHRQAHRVDDQMRDAGPEIHRAGDRRSIWWNSRSGVRISTSGAKITRFSTALSCANIRRVAHSRMRLVVARRIGHRAGEAANLAAIEDVGDPQQPGQNHRQRQPEQFARHRQFPLNSIFSLVPAGRPRYTKRAALRYARTRT